MLPTLCQRKKNWSWGKDIKNKKSALRSTLNPEAGISCLQKLFHDKKDVSYKVFNFWWSRWEIDNVKVLTIDKKKLN